MNPRRLIDVLHDLGDAVAAARRAAETLAPGGRVLLVEPFANDRIEDNLGAVGQLYYAASSMICCGHAISEGGRMVLVWAPRPDKRDWQRSSARRTSPTSAGRAETPFNLIFEVRR
jgi:hypothetical protein